MNPIRFANICIFWLVLAAFIAMMLYFHQALIRQPALVIVRYKPIAYDVMKNNVFPQDVIKLPDCIPKKEPCPCMIMKRKK